MSCRQKYKNYRCCVVRECKNTSIKTPGKLWIKAPSEANMRNTWLQLANKDPASISTNTIIYFCEDHFDLENDMENYTKYKIMGSVKRICMKQGCVPSRFECQAERKRKLISTSAELERTSKKTVLMSPATEQVYPVEISTSSFHQEFPEVLQRNIEFRDEGTQVQPLYAHKVAQACIRPTYRSKGVQCCVAMKNAFSSPIQDIAHPSPKKLLDEGSNTPSTSGQLSKTIFFTREGKERDESYTPSREGSSFDSSPTKLLTSPSTCSSPEKHEKQKTIHLQSTLSKIKLKPRLYIGIPSELYFIIDLLSKHTKLSEKHILLCLTKIRLNKTFAQLGDDFELSKAQASKLFKSKMSAIVSALSPFVKKFTKTTIKKNLPIAFRHKYNKVNCIIDCLEIEIQKPKKAIHQALTWSEYKKANTIKYLVACTPDGLVTFVSGGYGGRVSDANLVENTNFLDSLEPNSCILADRGFKHIEILLKQRGFTLLRPPSVAVGSQLSKSEAKHTKEIASLRIHVERVIRRIREFSLLKPHSVVNLNLLSVLDFCVTTACALINLQDSLIK